MLLVAFQKLLILSTLCYAAQAAPFSLNLVSPFYLPIVDNGLITDNFTNLISTSSAPALLDIRDFDATFEFFATVPTLRYSFSVGKIPLDVSTETFTLEPTGNVSTSPTSLNASVECLSTGSVTYQVVEEVTRCLVISGCHFVPYTFF